MSSVKIPLHLPRNPSRDDALERLALHAEMSTMNPNRFRTVSNKQNRRRERTRVEKLAQLVGATS